MGRSEDLMTSKLSAMLWETLHAIAINFPDKNKGLTATRLKAYYTFFRSLEHVMPRDAWRKAWQDVTAYGPTELTWKSFSKIRDHRTLSTWLYDVHTAVRRKLGKPVKTANWASRYAPMREGAKEVGGDAIGIARIKDMLQKRFDAIDTFMKYKYGDEYKSWSRAEKAKMRLVHIDEAAAWYWTTLSRQQTNTVAGFKNMNIEKKRTSIVTKFDYSTRRARNIPRDIVSGIWDRRFRLN